MEFASILLKIKNFISESKRVFLITKKPSMHEFKIIIKVASIGMIIIGLIGFVITMIYRLVF